MYREPENWHSHWKLNIALQSKPYTFLISWKKGKILVGFDCVHGFYVDGLAVWIISVRYNHLCPKLDGRKLGVVCSDDWLVSIVSVIGAIVLLFVRGCFHYCKTWQQVVVLRLTKPPYICVTREISLTSTTCVFR